MINTEYLENLRENHKFFRRECRYFCDKLGGRSNISKILSKGETISKSYMRNMKSYGLGNEFDDMNSKDHSEFERLAKNLYKKEAENKKKNKDLIWVIGEAISISMEWADRKNGIPVVKWRSFP